MAVYSASRLRAPANDGRLGDPGWLPQAQVLADRGTDAGALMALALLAVIGPRSGWPAEARDLLRTLRMDPNEWTRSLATAVLTAAE